MSNQKPQYNNDDERKQAYQNERVQRWTLEDALLDPIAQLLCDTITKNLGHPATYQKYAEPLIRGFEQSYPGTPISGEVRGAPDLLIQCAHRTWYVELKIKKHRFNNTVRGTQNIPKYGCQSQYLDDSPVYVNLLKHAAQYRLDLNNVVLLYAVNPYAENAMPTPLVSNEWQMECIRLNSLKTNIEAKRYGIYGGGY